MKLPNLITLALYALLAANYFGCLTDLDWSWQVRTGQRIIESGSLRTHDTFSYTLDGKLLHDFEWLWEVLLWNAWNLFGLGGLKLLRVLFVAAPLGLLGWRLQRDGLRWHVIVLALVSAFYVAAPAWNLRPLYCTTIGLFLCWSMLHDLCVRRKESQTQRTQRQPENRSASFALSAFQKRHVRISRLNWIWLPLTMLLWANMHPGVITGQALIVGAIGWEWLNYWLQWNQRLDLPALRRLTIIGAIALAATFISPDPIDRLLYPFSPDLKHPIFGIFVEMQPLHRFLFRQPLVAPVVYATAALVLFTIYKRCRHFRGWELALLAGLAFLGSVAVRSLMDWYVIMLAIGLPHVQALYVDAVKRRPLPGWLHGLLRLDNGVKRLFAAPAFGFQPGWLLAGVGVLGILTMVPGLGRDMPLRDAPDWPVAALDHIEQAGLSGNFFAPPDYGAYIGWRLKNRARTYMDTRGFFFPPALVEDSHYLPAMGPQWRRRLDRVLDDYPTEYFLLETWGVRGALWRALAPHVAEPLYRDSKSVLLTAEQVRRGVAHLDAQIAAN